MEESVKMKNLKYSVFASCFKIDFKDYKSLNTYNLSKLLSN